MKYIIHFCNFFLLKILYFIALSQHNRNGLLLITDAIVLSYASELRWPANTNVGTSITFFFVGVLEDASVHPN